jgi:prepilin-type N-terminal cleavage/methylation domain-containing protein
VSLRAAHDQAPRGVTLVELIVALTLFGILASVMLRVVREQQRFQVGVLAVIDTKRSARQAVDLLYAALRPTAASDIYAATDSSIAFRATHGVSHICSIDSARALITLPSRSATEVTALSTFLAIPRAGDSLLIFDPGDNYGVDDDRWRAHILTANTSGGACAIRPAGLASGSTAGLAIVVAPPLTASIGVGAPVRFFRPASYSLYRGSAGDWMLGYVACAAGACTQRQPISGPYSPSPSTGARGVAFNYFDAQGAPTSDPARIARADVTARSQSATVLTFGHIRGRRYEDSLASTIAFRNRQ